MPADTEQRIKDLFDYYLAGLRENEATGGRRTYAAPGTTSEKQKRRLQRRVASLYPQPLFDQLIARFRAADFAVVPSAMGKFAAIDDEAAREKLLIEAIAGRWGLPQIEREIKRRGVTRPVTSGRKVRRVDGVRDALARLDYLVPSWLKHLGEIHSVLGDRPLAATVMAASSMLEKLLVDAHKRQA